MVAYSPLVKYVAGKIGAGLPSHVDDADLISYGLVGLIGAIERYDPDREIRFETFAVARVRGAILDELRSLDWVPRSVRARAREVEHAHVELEHELQRAPTEGEVAERLGIEMRDLRRALLEIANSSILALDDVWAPGGSEEPQIALLETIRDPDAVDPLSALDETEVRARLLEAIESLPERERLVIALYYYEDLTLREIGEVLEVTESRVCQLHAKAMIGLRAHVQALD